MNRLRPKSLIVAFMTIALAGCGGDEPLPEPIEITPMTFEGGTARIETETDTFLVHVEIAESDEQRRTGLMRRESLAADSGMIFLFPREQSADDVFWMFQTLVPLSIAFIDEDGRIGSIRNMEPCPSPYPQYCPYYAAGVRFTSALEVNRGYFARQGIGVGDRVVFTRE